ncbi:MULTISPECIES: helix-turn-helix domain-containing protein [unclassified Citricoccus]|jgi:DNA-binding transcriptional ArsR family regulator|uniref:helix-turn-helix domain-containing protein n=1 Tax=Citricoccus TaxID=169133 RepID=UPI000255ED94|nr:MULTISPECIES: MarR family transcriptional regulator [unclassified Citricoccus]HRO29334.1 helix-turn-helix domain-containing protein [Citricoccus sp.]HRO92633.1 helix-turn-helix domain-containing protein [Citricoccus sp.]
MTELETAPAPGSESDQGGRRPVVISDPQAIRALAHEARLEALEELYASQSTRTATELASRCGLSPSAMSYHLRALEKYGFVERSPSEGDGRERRWKAAGYSLLVDSLNHTPTSKLAFIDVQLNTFRDRIMKEVARREAEDKEAERSAEVRRPPVLSTGMIFVDSQQRAEFQSRLAALIDEFEELNPASERSVDAERVYYLVSVLADAAPGPADTA